MLGRMCHRGRPPPAGQAQADVHPPPRHRRPRDHHQRRQGRAHRRQGRPQEGATATRATRAASAARPTPTCWPASPRRRSAAPSGACSRRTASAARCSASSRSTPGPSTPTRPSSPAVRARPAPTPRPADRTNGRSDRCPSPSSSPPAAASGPSPGSASRPAPARSSSTAVRSRTTSRRRPTACCSPSRCGSPSTDEVYDVDATLHGGGITGPGRRAAPGHRPGARRARRRAARPLKKAGFLTRDSRKKESQEVRAQEGPQGTAVLQALIAPAAAMAAALRHRRRARRRQRRADRRAATLGLGRGPRRRVLGGDRFVVGRDTRALRARARGGAGRRVLRPRASTSSCSACVPTPGGGLAVSADGVAGGDDLGLAQPVRRQRHQAVRRRRAQADRRRRGRPSRPRSSASWPATSATRSAATRGRRDPSVEGRRRPSAYERRTSSARSRAGGSTGCDVVLDCANGAASEVAPDVFDRLGARRDGHPRPSPTAATSTTAAARPHPEALAGSGASAAAPTLGLAFDGDADRVLAVDAAGALVDGDQLIAICAIDLQRRGRLRGDTVVVTVMTNLGLPPGHGARRASTWSRPRSATATCSRRSRPGGFTLGGEQSRPRDLPRPGHHRRRPAHRRRRSPTSSSAPAAPLAELAGRGDDPPAPGAASTCGSPARPPDAVDRRRAERRRGRGRARRDRAGAGAPERHRAAGAGDGRGRRPTPRPSGGRSRWPSLAGRSRCGPRARPDWRSSPRPSERPARSLRHVRNHRRRSPAVRTGAAPTPSELARPCSTPRSPRSAAAGRRRSRSRCRPRPSSRRSTDLLRGVPGRAAPWSHGRRWSSAHRRRARRGSTRRGRRGRGAARGRPAASTRRARAGSTPRWCGEGRRCGPSSVTACAPRAPSIGARRPRRGAARRSVGYLSIQQALSAIDRLEVRGRDSAGLAPVRVGPRARPRRPAVRVARVPRGPTRCSPPARCASADGDARRSSTRRPPRSASSATTPRRLRAAIARRRAAAPRPSAAPTPRRWCSATPAGPASASSPSQRPPAQLRASSRPRARRRAVRGRRAQRRRRQLRRPQGDRTSLRIPTAITTDAKVIPSLVVAAPAPTGARPRRGLPPHGGGVRGLGGHRRGRRAERPAGLLLALRGSGQALYVGLAEDAFIVASEPYGVVEETASYLRMDGETPAHPENPTRAAARSSCSTPPAPARSRASRAVAYDGTELPVDAPTSWPRPRSPPATSTAATSPTSCSRRSREAPASFRKTLRGKLVERDGLLARRARRATLPAGRAPTAAPTARSAGSS